jgi:hypothetical protein
MTEAQIWSGVALLSLAGWGTFIVMVARSVLPQANALGSLHKIDALIDDRITKIIDRIRSRQTPPPAVQSSQQPSNGQTRTNPIEQIFGGTPLEPIGDQPDSDSSIEVVS